LRKQDAIVFFFSQNTKHKFFYGGLWLGLKKVKDQGWWHALLCACSTLLQGSVTLVQMFVALFCSTCQWERRKTKEATFLGLKISKRTFVRGYKGRILKINSHLF
jgi:hypothetical protein